jgi:hypothetical protein
MELRLRKTRPNLTEVELGDLSVWFSYETAIAFHHPIEGHVVRENEWTGTTASHMGNIERNAGLTKRDRVPTEEFQARLGRAVSAVSAAHRPPGAFEVRSEHPDGTPCAGLACAFREDAGHSSVVLVEGGGRNGPRS